MRFEYVACVAAVVVSVAVAVLLPPDGGGARGASSLERKIDRTVAAVARCRGELDQRAPRSERRYLASSSVPFKLWTLRLWRHRAAECRSVRRALVASWRPTMLCESNKNPAAGGTLWRTLVSRNRWGTFYFALQFVDSTWDAHRGGYPTAAAFAARGAPPSPAQQAVVASRLGYDGWPNCPNR